MLTMGINEIEDEFVKASCRGLWFPFLTARELSKRTKTDISNTHKIIKRLLKCRVLKEHPLNKYSKEKRYHMNKDYYKENYIGILKVENTETSIQNTQPNDV